MCVTQQVELQRLGLTAPTADSLSDSRESVPPRVVQLNPGPEVQLRKFGSNSVHTAKYNVITFLPRFLFEQFSQVAYFYFLTQVRFLQLLRHPSSLLASVSVRQAVSQSVSQIVTVGLSGKHSVFTSPQAWSHACCKPHCKSVSQSVRHSHLARPGPFHRFWSSVAVLVVYLPPD